MQITRTYNLPFESEFDWRAVSTEMIIDLATQSIAKLMSSVNEESMDIDWKDRRSALLFVMKEGIFEEMCSDISERAQKMIKDEL